MLAAQIYRAFRAVGQVMRTVALLRYLREYPGHALDGWLRPAD